MTRAVPTRAGSTRVAAVAAAALGASLLVAAPAPVSRAADSIVDPAVKSDTRFTAEPLPTWQTNGVVYAIEAVGDVVYVGGNFSTVRPPGAPDGVSEVPRKNMAAFDAATGELLPFQHSFSAPDFPVPDSGQYDKTCQPGSTAGTYTCDTVYEVRASRDGKRLYVGGDFQRVDGEPRGNVASFALPRGNLTRFAVDRIYGRVRALAVSGKRLYFGGGVFEVSGRPRAHLAAVWRSTGRLTRWRPRTDGPVIALELTRDNKRVLIGGDFDRVNGKRNRGVRAVNPRTGANTRWRTNPLPGRAGGDRSFATDFAMARRTVYVSAEGLRRFDGRLAMNPYNGAVRWKNNCRGATWALEKVGGLLYTGSHAHNCSQVPGGFGETSNNLTDPADAHWHRFQAESANSGAPSLRHWFPTTNGGIVGSLGPRDLAWSRAADVLWAGGEFTTVNGEDQQGLVRFGRATSAATSSAQPETPSAPLAVSDTAGRVRVLWEASVDMDNAQLTYTLLRNGSPVATRTAVSDHDVNRPVMTFLDDDVTAGQTVSYRVVARDASGEQSDPSTATSVVVAGSAAPYRAQVRAAGPTLHWPLDDQADRVAGPLVVAGGAGRYTSGGVFQEVPGIPGTGRPGTSVGLDGTLGMVRGRQQTTAPTAFSTEIWFRGSGSGKLSGFGSSNVQKSQTADRLLYVDTDGRLVLGVLDAAGTPRTVRSAETVDDGQWHHAVGTLGPDGMRLYLDGQPVAHEPAVTAARAYSGYWQLGGDSLDGWPGAPTNPNHKGELDEFAVYDRAIGAAEVAAHFDAGTS